MSAADLVESFDLNRLPDTFYDNPFSYYRALRENDGDRLSETELLHNCIFILNAGHKTSQPSEASARVVHSLRESRRHRSFRSAKMCFAWLRFIRRDGIVLALPHQWHRPETRIDTG